MSFRGSLAFPSDLRSDVEDQLQSLLRVRRERGGITAASLRLGLDVAVTTKVAAAATLQRPQRQQRHTSNILSEVIFRRVVQDKHMHNSIRANKRQVLDAVIVAAEDSGDGAKEQKRRKLTLQLVEPNASFCIATPPRSYPDSIPEEERKVEESLLQVFQGDRLIQEHLALLQTLPDPYWQILCCQDHGNWLHACALWNEANVVKEQLLLGASSETSSKILSQITNAVNGECMTPLQLAAASGNDQVQEVLQGFADQQESIQSSYDDDTDYEYDLYCLDDNNGSCASMQLQDVVDGEEEILDCELSSDHLSWCSAGGYLFESRTGNSFAFHHHASAKKDAGARNALSDFDDPTTQECTESCTETDDW